MYANYSRKNEKSILDIKAMYARVFLFFRTIEKGNNEKVNEWYVRKKKERQRN